MVSGEGIVDGVGLELVDSVRVGVIEWCQGVSGWFQGGLGDGVRGVCGWCQWGLGDGVRGGVSGWCQGRG